MVLDKRDSNTLNELIIKFVLPGSIVITDGWKRYSDFKNNMDYEHHWFKNSLSFMSMEGFHTNNIEGMWNGMKIKIKPQGRVEVNMREYLFEFI